MPEDRQGYRSKTELALEMVGRAQERGHLKAGWAAADDAFGMSPSFREGLAALGMWYVLDVPSGFTVWPPEPAWTSAEYQGFGRPRQTQAARRSAPDHGAAQRTSCRRRPGVRLRWPREARGHAATFSAPRGCDRPAGASPAKSTGPSTAGTAGRQRTPLLPVQCSGGYPAGDPGPYVGGSRWRIRNGVLRRRKAT